MSCLCLCTDKGSNAIFIIWDRLEGDDDEDAIVTLQRGATVRPIVYRGRHEAWGNRRGNPRVRKAIVTELRSTQRVPRPKDHLPQNCTTPKSMNVKCHALLCLRTDKGSNAIFIIWDRLEGDDDDDDDDDAIVTLLIDANLTSHC